MRQGASRGTLHRFAQPRRATLRRIAQEPDINLTVLFGCDRSVRGYRDKGFGTEVKWDIPLLDGTFGFSLGIQSRDGILYDWLENAGTFAVMNPGKTTGFLRLNTHAALISTESDVDSSAALA